MKIFFLHCGSRDDAVPFALGQLPKKASITFVDNPFVHKNYDACHSKRCRGIAGQYVLVNGQLI